jgi:hypothetical protein
MNQTKQRARLSRSVKLDLWSVPFFIAAGLVALGLEIGRPMNVPLFVACIIGGVAFQLWSARVRYKEED